MKNNWPILYGKQKQDAKELIKVDTSCDFSDGRVAELIRICSFRCICQKAKVQRVTLIT